MDFRMLLNTKEYGFLRALCGRAASEAAECDRKGYAFAAVPRSAYPEVRESYAG